MLNEETGCPAMRYLGFGILAVVVGIPGLLFLAAITWGALLIPVVAVVVLAPFVLAYSVLWGPLLRRNLTPGRAEAANTDGHGGDAGAG
jgi:hypothetical protein